MLNSLLREYDEVMHENSREKKQCFLPVLLDVKSTSIPDAKKFSDNEQEMVETYKIDLIH